MSRLALALLLLIPFAASAQDSSDPYSAIIERPLFDPLRHRYVPPPPPPEPAPAPVVEAPPPTTPEAPLPVLVGVASSSDAEAIAIVRASDGTMLRLARGGEVDGWRVVAVNPASIDLERDGEKRTVELTAAPVAPVQL